MREGRLWRRICTKRNFSLLLITHLVLVILFVSFNKQQTAGQSGGPGLRWSLRKLAKGEPSAGAEMTERGAETEEAQRTEGTQETEGSQGIDDREDDNSGGAALTRLEIYRDRKAMIKQTCQRYGLGNFTAAGEQRGRDYRSMEDQFPWPVEKSLMYQSRWNLLYCWIHKAASSSWSEVFFTLKGREVPASRLHEATQYFSLRSHGVDLASAVRSSLVFTIVRHPFDRLVSAYRDKFELARKYAYIFQHYASNILAVSDPDPSGRGHHLRRPTFSEFVTYLLRTPVSEYNDHWVPYWLHCHLCQLEYDVIGKMETLREDIQFITERSGLKEVNVTLPWANRKSSSKGEDNVSLEYFKQLTRSQVMELYEIFRPDFEMFDYDVTAYLELSTP